MRETYQSINDDYALLSTKKYYFYYGYEFDSKECDCGDTEDIWGFEVTKNNKEIFKISANEMEKYKECPSKWQCEEMLLFGIGLFLDEVEE